MKAELLMLSAVLASVLETAITVMSTMDNSGVRISIPILSQRTESVEIGPRLEKAREL